jgi:hypothetical protein
MYVCMLNHDGEIVVHRNMPTSPEALLKTMAPYREKMAIAVEGLFTWDWLADLCAQEGIPFVLGHALSMTAIHRFPRVQDVVSYGRFVKGAKASAGKRHGTSGTKIGQASLQWAFSEAAVLF